MRKKRSISLKGRKLSIEIRKKMGLSRKGHITTKETREKISKANNGKKKYIGFGEKISKARIGIFVGEKSGNWKGGITPFNQILRTNSFYKIWREAVFLRDNFTCQNPNCEYCNNKIGVILNAHHIKPFALYPELRFNIKNGITYCKEFHLNSKLLHKNILKIEGKNKDELE